MADIQLYASDAYRWINCEGSAMMRALFPAPPSDDESTAAKDGKAFHWLARQIIMNFVEPGGSLITSTDAVGQQAPNGVVIDEEMHRCAADYATQVFKYCNNRGLMQQVETERQITLSGVHPAIGEGFADVVIRNDAEREFLIIDGKYGHRGVEVFENWQLILYALGILDELGVDGAHDDQVTFRLAIFQPRSWHFNGPYREWVVTGAELRGYRNKAQYAAERAVSCQGSCTTGPQCYKCDARHACSALQQSAYSVVDYVSNIPIGQYLTGDDLALELKILERAKDALNQRYDALEQQAIHDLRQGQQLPGWDIQQGYGRERWRKDTPTDEVIMMGDLMGEDLRKPVELISPSQAAKKGIDETVIKQYSEKPKTKMKLVKDDGTRARLAFNPNR